MSAASTGAGAAPDSFACITCGSFSGTNGKVFPPLEAAFAELSPSHFDVADWLHSDRRLMVASAAHVLAENGPLAFAGRTRFRKGLYRSAYLDRRVGEKMRARAERHRYAFSFQTQSMYDASVPGLPHFVYTDHTALANSYYPDFDPDEFSREWLDREGLIYRNARLTFTMSEHVARSLVEHYGVDPDRARCVGAGSNVGASAGAATAPATDRKQILFVGRDWERKGGPELIAALALVRKQHPEATLVVAGCSPRLETDGVRVLGDVPVETVAELFAESSLFCMPTRVEPFGLVFVESLTFGVPVVSTNIGALPDIVQDGETGFLVPPDDTPALAAAIVKLLDDPEEARRFGVIGRQRMLDRFTWPHVADSMAAQIRDALGAPSSARP
jgi:glycosyltransferase involved in cell wall biosynthesis